MNSLRSFLLFALVGLLFVGCYDDPDFSDVPRLTDIDVYTKEISRSFDSLVIRVGFEDGDGDLGIIGNENEAFFLVPNPRTGEPFWIYDKNDLEQIPYDCRYFRDIDLTPDDTVDRKDTVRVEFNEEHFNFTVSLFTKEDGQYQEVDFIGEPACSTPLGGRFLPLRDDFSVDSPLKGVLQWGTAGGYSALYRNDTLRIDVVVRDRAGNVSNVATFEDFTIDGVRRATDGG